MKKLITLLLLAMMSFGSIGSYALPIQQAAAGQHLKKDGTPDKRFKSNKHVTKAGKPDMRFKENKKKKH